MKSDNVWPFAIELIMAPDLEDIWSWHHQANDHAIQLERP